ncbi:MAG TPA: SpoIVB peptidase S55 domain-containing protein, partial [Patescibacteria group bacterium]|nr:SpoIVB peptidase S55 domain-containing protein [Patescibacteria group bacterium]
NIDRMMLLNRRFHFSGWLLPVCGIIFCCLLTLGKAGAAPLTMPVEEIRPGMQGVARTVVSGSQIEEFSIEVLGILKQKGPSGDLILIRAAGDVVDRTGGIAQGMSGSPVYIDGRLVGAIGYGWPFTDHKTGMVTPIADMLKLWELPLGKPPAVSMNPPPADDLRPDENIPEEKLNTPLLVAGFGDKALALLRDRLRPYNLVPYSAGGEADGMLGASLEPGSPIGVQLVRGDVSVGAMGTVTYVEDGRVLAFGHPFLKRGAAGYFMTAAQVLTTMSGLENSFKVGLTGQPIGVIDQDRGAGISGRIGVFPPVIPISVTVTDQNLRQIREMNAQMVNDDELSPILGIATIFNAIEKTCDRIGSGTARVKMEITSPDITGESLKRDNMFYSPANIGEAALAEIFEGMAILAGNPFKAVDITGLTVNVEIDAARRTASIQEAKPAVTKVKAGDRVPINVKLKPFRGEEITRQIFFVVPKDQPSGPMTLIVRGGGMVPLVQMLARQQANGEEDAVKLWVKNKPKNLDDAVRELSERDRNNDLVVEVMNLEYPGNMGETEEPKGSVKSEKPQKPQKPQPPQEDHAAMSAKAPAKSVPGQSAEEPKEKRADGSNKKFHLTTDYIIDNVTQMVIDVKGMEPRTSN